MLTHQYLKRCTAALTMAVVSLCGGGKAVAEQKGTLSLVEVRGIAALRPDARKKIGESLRDWLQGRHPDWLVRTKSGDPIAIWSPDGIGDALSDLPTAQDVSFHEVAEAEQSDLREGRVPENHIILPHVDSPGELVAIAATPLLDASDVASATVTFDISSAPAVDFRFTPEAAKVFGAWTQKSIGQRFAIVVEKEVLSAPVVREPILGGSGQISGNFTVAEAALFALRLNSSLDGVDFVVKKTCRAARPRAPPDKMLDWLTPLSTCE